MANFLKPVRRNAGLGDPPEPYFNNLPESANAVVKREVDSKPSEMSHFCSKMEALVNQQRRDCEAAVLNRGPYQLADEFQTLEISSQNWFQMNIKQRESALQKFWKAQLPSVHCDDASVPPFFQGLIIDSTERLPEVGGYKFSVQAEESGLAGVPLLLLKEMYSQASQLLESEEAVLRAPSNNQKAYVIRNDGGGKPHYVYQEESGKVVCEECPRFKSAKICCHALVVAEKCGGLSSFFSWFKRSQKTITATSFITSDSSKTVGKKGDQAKSSTARRKGGRSKTQASEADFTKCRADLSLQQQLPDPISMPPRPHAASDPLTQPPMGTLQVSGHPTMASATQPLSHLPSCPLGSDLQSSPGPRRSMYPSPAYGAFLIYPLVLCPPLVSTCFGCSGPLKPGGQIAPPPGDIVIVSNMLRSYFHNNKEYHKPSNVYFHCQAACVRAKQPYFHGGHLQFPPEATSFFTPEHHSFLRGNLGVSL